MDALSSSDRDESEPTRRTIHVECSASPVFDAWLARVGGSLAITTYQFGKVAMVGSDGRQVTLLMRQFDKPMGLVGDANRLALATRREIFLFANARLLAPEYLEDQPGRYDALYLPRTRYLTGDLNVHDVAFDREGLVFINTRFSCLARPSDLHSFTPIWRPHFVTDLVPEDRCHLNGLAIVDGEPRYVTCLGATDSAGAWRTNKATGGLVMDVRRNEAILEGLCMPHSPRWHQGRLWFLNSGMGQLCVADESAGTYQPVAALPGYLRGLSFAGPYALVGMSKIREQHIFGGLPIAERHQELQCGVAVVDTRNGAVLGNFAFTAGCEELFEVQFLPGVRRGMIVHGESRANAESITHPESSWWLRPSKEIRDAADAGAARPDTSADENLAGDKENAGSDSISPASDASAESRRHRPLLGGTSPATDSATMPGVDDMLNT